VHTRKGMVDILSDSYLFYAGWQQQGAFGMHNTTQTSTWMHIFLFLNKIIKNYFLNEEKNEEKSHNHS
jgi:hypothetical protein